MMEKRTCVVCKASYERLAWMTFDQGQCDTCISRYFAERAVEHLDREITREPPEPSALREAQRIHKVWHK